MKGKRAPAVAGTFYSEEPDELRLHIATLFEQVPEKKNTDSAFFIAPHAGYIYSGLTASYLYTRLQKKQFRTIVVISPSHYDYFRGISIYPGTSYETPLGEVVIDKEKADKLIADSKLIRYSEQGHRQEHAVEVQLPFLQYALGDFLFIPIVMGTQDEETIDELADKLQYIIGDDTAIVVSSDLSHFHKKNAANIIDGRLAAHIQSFNHEALYNDLQSGICEACGGGGIVAAMRVISALNKPKPDILHRSDSGDFSGDNSRVVGYLSATLS